MKEEGDIKKCPWDTSTQRALSPFPRKRSLVNDKETVVLIFLGKEEKAITLLTKEASAGPR